MAAFSRYGGGNSLYDRSLYNTIFSAPKFLDRDIKQTRTKLEEPRFHICLLGHPFFFINVLFNERNTYDDGLLQRFLLCSPIAPMILARAMRLITGRSILSLHCLFYLIYMIHFGKRRNYTFSADSLDLLDSTFDQLRVWALAANQIDPFYGYINSFL